MEVAAGSAAGFVVNEVAKAFWEVQLKRHEKAKIEAAVVERKVLGGNIDLRRKPDDYAHSPLIKHIKNHCTSHGTIYVAYVPNNNGKTTASVLPTRDCIFPESLTPDESYFDEMVDLLKFNREDPPEGFMTRILEALAEGKTDPKLSRNFLILDNFMPHGFNPKDCNFLHKLKGKIKEMRVTALILTPNREAACFLIAQNSLGAIVPLASDERVLELRCANETIDPREPLDFDWEKEVSMVWEKDELKKALEYSLNFRELDKTKQGDIRRSFDEEYNKLSKKDQDAANPVLILKRFGAMKTKNVTPTKIRTNAAAGGTGFVQGSAHCCTIL